MVLSRPVFSFALLVLLMAHMQYTPTAAKTTPTTSCQDEGAVKLGYNDVLVCERGESSALNWTVICDSDWTVEDAKVACRSLNLSSEDARNITYGQTSIYAESQLAPNCTGTEANLSQCMWSAEGRSSDCNGYLHVGVECPTPTVTFSSSSFSPSPTITVAGTPAANDGWSLFGLSQLMVIMIGVVIFLFIVMLLSIIVVATFSVIVCRRRPATASGKKVAVNPLNAPGPVYSDLVNTLSTTLPPPPPSSSSSFSPHSVAGGDSHRGAEELQRPASEVIYSEINDALVGGATLPGPRTQPPPLPIGRAYTMSVSRGRAQDHSLIPSPYEIPVSCKKDNRHLTHTFPPPPLPPPQPLSPPLLPPLPCTGSQPHKVLHSSPAVSRPGANLGDSHNHTTKTQLLDSGAIHTKVNNAYSVMKVD